MELEVLMQLTVRIMTAQCSLDNFITNIYRIVNAHLQYLFFHQQNKSVFSSETTCARKEI